MYSVGILKWPYLYSEKNKYGTKMISKTTPFMIVPEKINLLQMSLRSN